jgi:hypothetical protein
MQDDGGLAHGIAADLPVDALAVAHLEHTVVVRLNLREQTGHGGLRTFSQRGLHNLN